MSFRDNGEFGNTIIRHRMTFCKSDERRVANSRAPLRVLKSHAPRGCSQLFPPLLRPTLTHTHARSLVYFPLAGLVIE